MTIKTKCNCLFINHTTSETTYEGSYKKRILQHRCAQLATLSSSSSSSSSNTSTKMVKTKRKRRMSNSADYDDELSPLNHQPQDVCSSFQSLINTSSLTTMTAPTTTTLNSPHQIMMIKREEMKKQQIKSAPATGGSPHNNGGRPISQSASSPKILLMKSSSSSSSHSTRSQPLKQLSHQFHHHHHHLYRRRRPLAVCASGWPPFLLLLATSSLLILHLITLASSNSTPPNSQTIEGCKFYPVGENRRFERVAENLPVGSEIFKLEAHPRSDFKIEPIDNSLSDVNYFKYAHIDDKFVAIKLNQSLEDLVDRRDPQNVLKFKLTCRGIGSQEDSFLPVTVYIHDVNDHAPEFQNVPYHLEVDELTPVGLTIFRSIHAIDRDKPNTANSDITYSIVGGNDNDSFILSDPIEGILVMNKALDFDHGNREYKIQIQASDHGTPSLSSVTTMTVKVKDADDQNPIFSHELYTASVSESAQITGKRIRDKVRVEPAIMAYDQDTGINARLRYSIILGNEGGFFEMNAQTGELFLIREIDLEKLNNPTLSLQIQASQVDNPFRQALARVDISVQDINDNSPEFEYDMYNITVIENLPPGFTVLQVFATDSDQGENAQFKYVLHDDSGAFKIEPSSGWISVKDPTKLDRETTDKIRMQVSTLERKPNVNPDIGKRKRGTSVEINLLDSNDNTPFFVGARQRSSGSPDDPDVIQLDAQQQQQNGNCLNVSHSSGSDADCVVPINLYNFQVLETATPGTQIGHVYAYDRDLGDNGRVQYFKQNDSISLNAPFDVNPLNGSLFVLPQFTRLVKKQSSYTLFIKAIDSAQIHFERRHSVAVIQINVTDINNSVPEFIGTAPFQAYVGESLPEGAFVTQIYAKDDDSITEQLEYSIVAGNDEKLFFIDSRSGKIYTSSVLDYERKQSYDLLVQVSDGVNTAVAPLIINIIDINDQQPIFAHQFYNFTILEESGANQTVGVMSALDGDSGKNAQLTYSLVGEQANDAFVLDPKTGSLRTRRSLDCELEPVIDFQVLARDGGIPQLTGTANVRVRVDDLNDWAPRFEQARYEIEVQEELEAPVDIYQIKAHDKDRDENAIIKYLIIGGNELNLFNINPDTGLISTAAKLNYEQKREHRLQVAARNVRPFQGPQARQIVNPAVEVGIRVADINDELVVFEKSSYHWKLSELTAKNTIIARVNATNPARSLMEQDIVYWLGPVQVLNSANSKNSANRLRNQLNGTEAAAADPKAGSSATGPAGGVSISQKLWIDEKSGELMLLEQLDRDPPALEQLFRFNVYARDRRSINKLNSSVPIVLDVIDVNDNAPTFDELVYNLEMPENLPAGSTIPTFFKVLDVDSGINGRIAGYYLNGSREELETFHINNVTGTITLKSSLDYERQAVHRFEVLAIDGGAPQPLVGSAQVIIQVANINEFSPKFINLPYEYQLQENAVPGTQVGQVRALDEDGNKIVYSLSDGDTEFFSIEAQTGKIYVARQLVPRTQYSFTVRATDDGQPQNYSLGVQVTIRIRDTNDYAPAFTSNSYLGTVVEKQTRSGTGSQVLVRVEAVDKDLQNNTITYSIISGNEDNIFTIDKRTGEIKVASGPQLTGSGQSSSPQMKLDYDKRKQYTLLVQAADSHESPLFGLTMVQLDVLDVNDHAPVFSKPAYVSSIGENSPPGTCFFRVEADSRDSDDPVQYSLSSSSAGRLPGGSGSTSGAGAGIGKDSISNLFDIHPTKGLICTKTQLDREQRSSYELTVTANDGRFESHAPISVEILDENDNRPQFDQDVYSVSIPYDSQPGRAVISVHASDPDAAANGQLQYWIKNTHGLFQIDAKTGQVRVVTRLPSSPPTSANNNNNQTTTTFELRVFAQDQGISPQIGEASLIIRLTNNENHPPKFDKFAYHASVDENISGVPLIQVQASDPDPGKAGKIVYRLVKVQAATLLKQQQQQQNSLENPKKESRSGTGGQGAGAASSSSGNADSSSSANSVSEYLRNAFKIDKSSGKIMLMEPLDYEETHNIELIIEARDEALNDAQSTLAFVQVQVNDLNDNKPEFLSMPKLLRIPASTQANSEIIYTIQALDGDSSANGNNQIEYRLDTPSKYFNIHPQSGALYAVQALPQTLAEGGQAPPELQAERLALPGGATVYSESLTVIAQDKSSSHPLSSERLTFEVEIYKDQDADDAHPIFNSNQYFVQSDLAIEAGTTILIPKATAPNGDPILYNITAIDTGRQSSSQPATSGRGSSAGVGVSSARSLVKRFAIDSETGKISTTNKLEASELAFRNIFHFIVRATNKLKPQLSSEAGVIVRLWDTNTRCPRFPFTEYYASIPENARVDSVAVGSLVIDEVERFAGQKLSYQITEDNSNDNFFIDVATTTPIAGQQPQQNSSSGGANSNSKKISVSLRVKKALDREAMPKFLGGIYTLTVTASNSKCATQARVKILIEDQNDNSPQFEKSDYQVELRENSPIGQVIVQLQASDMDELDQGRLRYFISEVSPPGADSSSLDPLLAAATSPTADAGPIFEMEQKSGTISVKGNVDRERASQYLLRVMALDQANNTGWTNVHVNILDENDWAPTFANETFYMNATEGPSSIGQRIRLPVFDYDDALNRQMEVYIVDGNAGNEFRLDVDEGGPLLTIVQELDWEKYASAAQRGQTEESLQGGVATHIIQVAAKDKGSPARIGKCQVLVYIHDINDNAPKFLHESYYEFIDENAPVGTVVAQVRATDIDSPINTNLTYSFVRTRGATSSSFTGGSSSVSLATPLFSQVGPAPATTPSLNSRFNQQQQQQQQAAASTLALVLSTTTSAAPPMQSQPAAATQAASSGRVRSASSQPVGLLAKPRQLRPLAATASDATSSAADSAAPTASSSSSASAAGSSIFEYYSSSAAAAGGASSLPAASSSSQTHRRLRLKRNAINSNVQQPQDSIQRNAAAAKFPFALDPITGVVSVAKQLDISEQQQYLLTIEAFDGLWRTESQMRIFVNEVEDPRDVSARSSEATNHYRFQVPENVVDALVGVVDLKPRKLRVNSQMKYSIVNSEMRQMFRISEKGEIFTLRALDRELKAQYTFTVMLEEKRGDFSGKLTVAEVIVDILDENDEIPTFNHIYHASIRENSPPGTPLFLTPTNTIRAVDNDTRNNSQISYSLSGQGSDRFAILTNGALLYMPLDESLVLDRELKSEYKLDVHAADSGNLSSKTTLTIKIEDENDNAPIFETGPLFVLIPETAKPGSKIVQVKARDRDEAGPNSEIHYKISSSTFSSGGQSIQATSSKQQRDHLQQQQQQQAQLSNVIRIDQNSGELFVVGQLQPSTSYNINVTATDSGGLAAQTQINVTVVDVNDHRPQFERSSYNFVLLEGNYTRNPLKLGTLKAFDEDIGKNSQIEYLLITDAQYEASIPVGNPASQLASLLQAQTSSQQASSTSASTQQQQQAPSFPISIDVHTGELFARGPIDREQRDSYIFKVMAIDMGESVQMNSTCEVTVKVKDINDEPPRFYTDPYLALVPENLDPGHKVTQIAAFDPDSGENGQVFYKLGDGHEGKFYIDGKDGTVWTLASLDYEQKNFYNITIIAYDRGTPSLHSKAKLWITVADMNDAVPNFAKAVYTLEVAENAKLGDTIFVLNAGKGAFKYSWLTAGGPGTPGTGTGGPGVNNNNNQAGGPMASALSGSPLQQQQQEEGMDTFTIEPNSGHIKLAKALDSVQRNHYRLMVKAQDESEPPKYDTAEINILVGTGQGVRLFAQRLYEVSVLENQLAPLVLIDLNCTDEMIHQPVQYSIVGSTHRGLFRIEPDTGRISVTSSLDREKRDSYTIKIKAETSQLNVRQKRETGGELSQPPLFRPQQRWSASTLTSSTTTRSPAASLLHRRHSAELAAHLHNNNHTSSAGIGTGTGIAARADQLQSFHLAYDETFVTILVEDENDNAPVFSNKAKPIVSAVPLEASFGYEIARVQAFDADFGLNAQIRYEIQSRADDASSKFYIDPVTGIVRSMVNFALDIGRVYNFDVRATDRDGAQDSGNSASVQLFVYVLPETKMVLMVTDTEPIVMEKRSSEVINYLSNITGFDVKMAKLEPHIEGEAPEPFSTDMFLYAVNPSLNNIVDTETLLSVLRQSSQTILSHLHSFKIRRIQGVSVQEKISQMGATEIAIIALSSIVFLGSIVAILLLCSCSKSAASSQHSQTSSTSTTNSRAGTKSGSSSSQQSIWDQQRAYSLKNPLMKGLGAAAAKVGGARGGGGGTGTNNKQRATNHLHSHLQHHHGGGAQSNSTYSTTNGDHLLAGGGGGGISSNSDAYVDSLISYKRSSGAAGDLMLPPGNRHQGRAAKGRQDWSLDDDLAAAMNEHHLHHLSLHQQQHNNQMAPTSRILNPARAIVASALGGGPMVHLLGAGGAAGGKGPRARLSSTTANNNNNESETEVHSDNEVFGDEEEEDDDQDQLEVDEDDDVRDDDDDGHGNQVIDDDHLLEKQQQVLVAPSLATTINQDRAGSVRSADRSMYSGDSSWDDINNNNNTDGTAQRLHHSHHHHHHHHHAHNHHAHTNHLHQAQLRPIAAGNSSGGTTTINNQQDNE